ncbi:MAG: hypothetical protein AAF610_06575 [Pseudomonadota bacterium]
MDELLEAEIEVSGDLRLRSRRTELISRCADLGRFLYSVNEVNWARWVEARIAEIRIGQREGVENLLAGFVGLGNIGEVFLCPEAGHDLGPGEEAALNEQFLLMLSKVAAVARDLEDILGGPRRKMATAGMPVA